MKNTLSKSFLDSIIKGKAPGSNELLALLQLIPDPSLIVSASNLLILGGNSALFLLTAFSQPELVGKPLSKLFLDVSKIDLSQGMDQDLLLNRLNRKPISIHLHMQPLDIGNQWLLLSIRLPHEGESKLEETQINVFNRFLAALNTGRELGSNSDKLEIVQFIQKETDALFAGIYLAASDSPILIKSEYVDPEEILPAALPSQDLMRLEGSEYWKPGNRVVGEMHKIARRESLSYIYTIPLGCDGFRFGLMVLGGNNDMPTNVSTGLFNLAAFIISQRLLYEQHRNNSQEEISRLTINSLIRTKGLEFAQEGILLLDTELRVRELNPQLEWMLGYAEKEVIGSPAENVLIGPERLLTGLNTALEEKQPVNLGVAHIHRRNGQSFPARILIFPVVGEESLEAILVYLTDISEHEQIQARTQQLEQRALLGDVTAIFAHEVRNPINNISTALQVLSNRMVEDDPNREIVQRMQNDCIRLNHLMESVLTFARQKEMKLETLDLIPYIQRFLDRWRPRLLKENITPYLTAEEGLPIVQADPRQLDQVFTNLISNALEAMHQDGGTLSIKLVATVQGGERKHIQISISDTGPGIPDEIRERLFEPFVSTKQSGTGLGLAITKQIITAHKGSINVQSFPGGTVFTILLPAYTGE